MKPLYNYGISQEDVLSESIALEINKEDSLLCIASGGEIPLNMAALHDVNILAVDNSINQIRLTRLKQAAALALDSSEAAEFLGYLPMDAATRKAIFGTKIRPSLLMTDQNFWDKQLWAIEKGVINAGRFEQYIRKFSGLALAVVGKKNFYQLFQSETTEEQHQIFEKAISGKLLRSIFKITFHPKVYKNRGIEARGLSHSGRGCMADLFFRRFKSFCCNTLAKKNYYLQYIFFNRLVYPDAVPEYLQPEYHDRFVRNQVWIRYRCDHLETFLGNIFPGRFNKIHLSNLGDWLSEDDMTALLKMVGEKTLPGAKIVLRYIHHDHKVSISMSDFQADYEFGEKVLASDRFPFYSIVPLNRLR